MRKPRDPICIVFGVPVQGRLLPVPARDLRASLGLRPMALAEVAKETDRPCLALLSDDDDLLARAVQIAARCGLKRSAGAVTIPRASKEAAHGGPPLVAGMLLSGPRYGFERMFEVLAVSADQADAALARAGRAAIEGPSPCEILCRGRTIRPSGLDLGGRPLVMGILNVTPDSFSDGGRWADPVSAIARGTEMASAGADIIDVGGESSRPGSVPVDAETECARVLPVIEALSARTAVPISVDTTKAEVARRAIASGAAIINDVSGMTLDPEMPEAAASLGVPVVLNHIRGVPRTMQEAPSYEHVVLEVLLEIAARVRAAREAGVAASQIVVDPGIGFGKRVEDNLALIRYLSLFRALGGPVLVGVSRKSFLGALTGRAVAERFPASIAGEVTAALAGADIIRTHEPAAAIDALKVAEALVGSPVSH